MLYDPKWERPTEPKTDPLTLPALTAWLETQPADQSYCFLDTGYCLIGRFLRAQGYACASVGGSYYRSKHGGDRIPFSHPAIEDIAAKNPHTFGAALARAREACSRS
jgi:hypothetical protein